MFGPTGNKRRFGENFPKSASMKQEKLFGANMFKDPNFKTSNEAASKENKQKQGGERKQFGLMDFVSEKANSFNQMNRHEPFHRRSAKDKIEFQKKNIWESQKDEYDAHTSSSSGHKSGFFDQKYREAGDTARNVPIHKSPIAASVHQGENQAHTFGSESSRMGDDSPFEADSMMKSKTVHLQENQAVVQDTEHVARPAKHVKFTDTQPDYRKAPSIDESEYDEHQIHKTQSNFPQGYHQKALQSPFQSHNPTLNHEGEGDLTEYFQAIQQIVLRYAQYAALNSGSLNTLMQYNEHLQEQLEKKDKDLKEKDDQNALERARLNEGVVKARDAQAKLQTTLATEKDCVEKMSTFREDLGSEWDILKEKLETYDALVNDRVCGITVLNEKLEEQSLALKEIKKLSEETAKELEESKKSLLEAEKKKSELQDEMIKSGNLLQQSEEKYAKTVNLLQSQLQKSEDTVKKLNSDLNEASKSVKDLQEEEKNLKHEAQAQSKQKDEVKLQLRQAIEEKDRIRKKDEKDKDDLKAAISSMEQEKEDLKSEVKSAEREKESLEEKLKESKKSLDKITKDMNATQKKSNNLEKELTSLKKEHSSVKEEAAKYEQELEELKKVQEEQAEELKQFKESIKIRERKILEREKDLNTRENAMKTRSNQKNDEPMNNDDANDNASNSNTSEEITEGRSKASSAKKSVGTKRTKANQGENTVVRLDEELSAPPRKKAKSIPPPLNSDDEFEEAKKN